jgi:hypothetical protein
MICVVCDGEFDHRSQQKKMAGGKINECPECSDEPEIKVLGLANGDGKQSQTTILKFDSKEDRETFKAYWHSAIGMDRGKSCQLGGDRKPTPNVKFKTIQKAENMNHKGKA